MTVGFSFIINLFIVIIIHHLGSYTTFMIIDLVRRQNLVRVQYQGIRNVSFSEDFVDALNGWSIYY